MLTRIFLTALFHIPLLADTLTGIAISVRDGNTFKLREPNGKTHLIRLLGTLVPTVPGPEYRECKKRLEGLILKKNIQVEWERSLSKCGQTPHCVKPGKVIVEGQDISLRLITLGFARHDKSAMAMQNTPDRTLYTEGEEDAQKKGIGLWSPDRRSASLGKKNKKKKRK